MKFEILPFDKCSPLDWNMLPADVERLIGAPEHATKNWAGHRIEFRFNRGASFIFDKLSGKLVEVSCSGESASLVFEALDLNGADPEDVVRALLSTQHQAVQGYGSIAVSYAGHCTDRIRAGRPRDQSRVSFCSQTLGRDDQAHEAVQSVIRRSIT